MPLFFRLKENLVGNAKTHCGEVVVSADTIEQADVILRRKERKLENGEYLVNGIIGPCANREEVRDQAALARAAYAKARQSKKLARAAS